MKKIAVIVSVLLIISLVIGGIFMLNKNPMKSKELILDSYNCSSSGDMKGSQSSTEIFLLNEEKAKCVYFYKDYFSDVPEVKEYIVSSKIFEELSEIYVENKIYRWEKLPKSKIVVLDGATTSYSFKSGKNYSRYSTSQITPKNYRGIIEKISEIILKYVKEGELLPNIKADELTQEEMYQRRNPTDGKVTLAIDCCYSSTYNKNGRLCFLVKNGTDEEIIRGKNVSLFKGDETIPVYENNDRYVTSIYPNRSGEQYIDLESPLELGKYTLKVDDLICEFVVE